MWAGAWKNGGALLGRVPGAAPTSGPGSTGKLGGVGVMGGEVSRGANSGEYTGAGIGG